MNTTHVSKELRYCTCGHLSTSHQERAWDRFYATLGHPNPWRCCELCLDCTGFQPNSATR